jgi:hypothetical protein
MLIATDVSLTALSFGLGSPAAMIGSRRVEQTASGGRDWIVDLDVDPHLELYGDVEVDPRG